MCGADLQAIPVLTLLIVPHSLVQFGVHNSTQVTTYVTKTNTIKSEMIGGVQSQLFESSQGK